MMVIRFLKAAFQTSLWSAERWEALDLEVLSCIKFKNARLSLLVCCSQETVYGQVVCLIYYYQLVLVRDSVLISPSIMSSIIN